MERINEMQVANEGVQMLVRMLYENQKQMFGNSEEITEEKFARCYLGKHTMGRIKEMCSDEYSEKGADYIADAVAVFGGYESYVSFLKKECSSIKSFSDRY